ncbi:MAG TPA: glycosyltransferase family 2 protein [Phycisphaerae bacterium]|nr:glycosyltransferase family 2 protein [Phycisphaerae bacterium]HRR84499.1 glycosyltransferase family 2 protein [Phycisphaerae bacterium]
MTVQENPFVSVIVAVRNEADFIERCLSSILDGDYPRDLMEVLVVDGMSDDGTREIVQRLSARDARIRLLDNEGRIVACGLNAGIRAARGQVITWLGGHAEYAPDFLRQSVETLKAHADCWCVGGPIETVSETYVGKVTAAAMSTPVGVGNAMFRLGGYEGYVDTATFASYWRWVFDKIGLFDEELVRNQDDEFNARLIRQGGKIWLTPLIRSRYYPRTSLGKLWRQYFQYGTWRIRTIQKLGQPATVRQVAPLLFVVGLVACLVGAAVWRPLTWLFAAYVALYSLGLLVGVWQVARQAGIRCALFSPVVFMILHFGYGLGSLKGIWLFVIRKRGGRYGDKSLSR